MTKLIAGIVGIVGLFAATSLRAAPVATIVSDKLVWDASPTNSFTDLTSFDGKLYMCFREASTHLVPAAGLPGGTIRVLESSNNGATWTSAATFSMGINNDLRDPKLTVTPQGQLMLMSCDIPNQTQADRQSYTWFSSNGTTWGTANPVGLVDQWYWRDVWKGSTNYVISYGSDGFTRLNTSMDGKTYQQLDDPLNNQSGTSEAGLIFEPNGDAVAIVRTATSSLIGTSFGNYTSWTWTDTGLFVGGPDMIQLPDGRIIVAARFTDTGAEQTELAWLNPTAGSLMPFLTLPSGGDTGYPGMVYQNGDLLVSYYSEEQLGKDSVYFATVAIPLVPEPCTAGLVMAGGMLLIGRRPKRN